MRRRSSLRGTFRANASGISSSGTLPRHPHKRREEYSTGRPSCSSFAFGLLRQPPEQVNHLQGGSGTLGAFIAYVAARAMDCLFERIAG